ncbi:hypothetical protein Btru_033337 [Bulinus truncatus]|nr:hypothetical protein Btru_033337 [Bulinus truncatus]
MKFRFRLVGQSTCAAIPTIENLVQQLAYAYRPSIVLFGSLDAYTNVIVRSLMSPGPYTPGISSCKNSASESIDEEQEIKETTHKKRVYVQMGSSWWILSVATVDGYSQGPQLTDTVTGPQLTDTVRGHS